MKIDTTNKNLLNIIQAEFPLSREPFAALGLRLGTSSDEVIRRIERLKQEGIVRQIGPVFNAAKLGYRTTLVAMKIAAEHSARASRIISAHPLVSHCYERDHDFNFWFTLAMPLKEDIESDVQKLSSRIKAEATLNLSAVKVFKIGAYFNLGGGNSCMSLRAEGVAIPPYAHHPRDSSVAPLPQNDREGDRDRHVAHAPRADDKYSHPPAPDAGIEYNSPLNADFELSAIDRAVINELQQDLPLVETPFDLMSAKLSMDVGEFLSHCHSLLQREIMRRYSASVNHNKLGFTANAMACWKVLPAMVETTGKKMATFPEVSHCYERRTSPLWPYNLYVMIHAKTREVCQAITGKISVETGLDKNDLVLLFSTREIKKVRVRYPV